MPALTVNRETYLDLSDGCVAVTLYTTGLWVVYGPSTVEASDCDQLIKLVGGVYPVPDAKAITEAIRVLADGGDA